MGRKRLDRKVVTYSIATETVKRIDELRQEKQERVRMRPTRVTISEILDEALAYFYTFRIQELWMHCPECNTINGWILKPKQIIPGMRALINCNKCTKQFNPFEAERAEDEQ
jgi:flagellar biosynthesis/type III secretory pathway chaperone